MSHTRSRFVVADNPCVMYKLRFRVLVMVMVMVRVEAVFFIIFQAPFSFAIASSQISEFSNSQNP